MTTIVDLLKITAEKYPDNPAVKDEDKTYTWREIHNLSDAYAAWLKAQGIKRGCHVGLLDCDSVHWILCFFAILKLGCIATLYNGKYKSRELAEVVQLSRTGIICVGDRMKATLGADVLANMETHPDLYLSEPDWKTFPLLKKELSDEMHDPQKDHEEEAGWPGAKPEEIACFIFTTGSTSRPKCVMLSNRSLVINADVMARKMKYTERDRICVATPLFHIFSLVCNLLAAMTVGASVILPENISSAGLLHCIEEESCTVFNGVPTSFLAMISNQKFAKKRVASVRVGTMGGAKVNRPQMEEITAAFPRAELMINYGSTEAGFACNTDEGDGVAITGSSVGRPMEHMEVAIEDLNTGKLIAGSQSGEILVKGSGLMDGYYGLPKEEQAIDDNGYLHTGDIGFIDENGRVTITDRKKNIINRGGENISPSEIESVIAGYKPVQDVVVLGVPHEVLGEEPVAFILKKQGENFSEEQLRKILADNLAQYKVPRKILLMDAFPLMANGKKDILSLKRLAAE